MENKKRGIVASTFLIGAVLFLALLVNTNYEKEVNDSFEDTINYKATVCVSKNNELIGCSRNLLYDTGKDSIKHRLLYGGGDNITWISLCNASTGSGVGCGVPVAGATEDFQKLKDCGMANVSGTMTDIGTGNWSIYHTFTSTCDNLEINATKLSNETITIAGTNFSGNNFSLVTLQTDDQLTINWTITVS